MNPTTNNGVTTTNTGATTSVVGTNVPQTFTFDQINGTTPLNTPVAPAPTNLLAGLGQTTQNDANQTNQQQAKEQNTYVDLLTSLGSQTADTQALQDQQGITTMQKDLLGLQNIAKQQQAQYNAGIVQAEAARNTRQETNVVQQNLTRQHGIDALLTNSLIAAKQGDITFANSLVDRAIAAKYEPIKARLEAQKFILDQVSGRAAENRKAALDVQMKEIEKQESRDKTLQDMIINASSQGAPADLVSRAQKAKTPSEAALVLGQYAGDYYAIEKMKLELNKLRGGTTGTGGSIGGGVGREVIAGVPIESPAYSWLDQYNAGSMSLEDIYTKIGSSKTAEVTKNQLSKLVAAQGGKRVLKMDDTQIAAINDQIKNINDLLGDSGYNYKVISGAIQGGALGVGGRVTGAKGDALAIARNLVSNQTLQALADAKAKGVTFGALSEAELNAVANSASRVASKIIKNEAGEITGFSGSEKGFKDDLLAIKKGLEKSVQAKTGSQVNKQVDLADKVLNQIGEAPVTGGYIFK